MALVLMLVSDTCTQSLAHIFTVLTDLQCLSRSQCPDGDYPGCLMSIFRGQSVSLILEGISDTHRFPRGLACVGRGYSTVKLHNE